MKIVLMILVICSLALPQDLPGWGFYGGVGMNNVKFSESGVLTPKPLMGRLAGVGKGVMLGGLHLFVGAGFGQRGFKIEESGYIDINEDDLVFTDEGEGVSGSMKVETSMNYLDAWMVMPYPVGPGLAWAGPIAGIFLSGKMKIKMEIDLLENPISQSEDIDEGPDDPEFGIIIGYSYPLPIMDGKLNLNGGNYLGLIEHDDITFNSIFAHLSYRL